MAITTIAGVNAANVQPRDFAKPLSGTLVAGRPHSFWQFGGMPPAGSASAAGLTGEVLTTATGQIPYTNALSGNTYLSRFLAYSSQPGTLLLCDRLWQNQITDLTLTSEQTFTSSVQIPARDVNGTTTGAEVYAALEITTVTGAGVPTLSFKYTNTAGTAGQIGANLVAPVAASIAGTFYPIGLAAGDVGIQKAQSITLSETWTSGAASVILYRVISRISIIAGANAGCFIFDNDALTGGFQKMYDNSVPFLVFIPQTTTTNIISGAFRWAQG